MMRCFLSNIFKTFFILIWTSTSFAAELIPQLGVLYPALAWKVGVGLARVNDMVAYDAATTKYKWKTSQLSTIEGVLDYEFYEDFSLSFIGKSKLSAGHNALSQDVSTAYSALVDQAYSLGVQLKLDAASWGRKGQKFTQLSLLAGHHYDWLRMLGQDPVSTNFVAIYRNRNLNPYIGARFENSTGNWRTGLELRGSWFSAIRAKVLDTNSSDANFTNDLFGRFSSVNEFFGKINVGYVFWQDWRFSVAYEGHFIPQVRGTLYTYRQGSLANMYLANTSPTHFRRSNDTVSFSLQGVF